MLSSGCQAAINIEGMHLIRSQVSLLIHASVTGFSYHTVGIGWVPLASATSGFSGYIKLAYCSSAKGLQ